MLKHFTVACFLFPAFTAPAQYLETFSTPNKGYLLNQVDDFSSVNWSLSAWANQPPATTGRDAEDYFQTTAAGVLESIDLDQEVCWESPLINTAAAPTVTLAVDLSWAGFDTDFNGNPCTEASLDYIKVQYSVNGGPYLTLPNMAGGSACATIGYVFGTAGAPFSGAMTVTQGGIPGGSNLRIRVCVNTNANAEIVAIDNVSVPTAGVTLGCTAPALAAAVTNITCGGPNSGAVDLSVSGGIPGYTYLWNNGNTQQDLANVAAGIYTVTVTDAAGCTATAGATVASAPFSVNTHIGPATCAGLPDGEIDLIVSGGAPPYTYDWTDLPGTGNPENRSGLLAGTYTVTVSDNGICTASASATVPVAPAGPYLETFDADGKGLLPGSTCTGPDAASCSNSNLFGVNWNIYSPDTLLGIETDDYFHTAGGRLEGSDFDQTICWETPAIDIDPPGAGVAFSVDLGWTGFDTEPPGPNPQDLIADHIDVEYSVDGGPWVRLPNQAGGGLTGHTVVYVNGSGSNLGGNVTVSAAGISGNVLRIRVCGYLNASAETISIDNVSAPSANGLYCPLPELGLTVSDALCFGGSDGIVNISVSGGTPGYTYLWSNGTMTEDLSGVPAGVYTVTVTDNAGYTITAMATVGEPAPVAATPVYDNFVCPGLEAVLTVTNFAGGAGAPYLFSINSGVLLDPAFPVSVGAGLYFLTYFDRLNCSAHDTISIAEYAPSNAVIAGPDTVCVNVPGAYSLPGNFSDYQWAASNNGTIASGQGTGNVQALWADPGSSILSVYFNNADNCPDTAVLNLFADICVGATDITLPGVQVSPNPFGHWLAMQFDRAVQPGTRLSLHDAQGRLLTERADIPAHTRLETAHLPAGVYWLKIVEGNRTGIWQVVKTE